jgi:hypothetical protein
MLLAARKLIFSQQKISIPGWSSKYLFHKAEQGVL